MAEYFGKIKLREHDGSIKTVIFSCYDGMELAECSEANTIGGVNIGASAGVEGRLICI